MRIVVPRFHGMVPQAAPRKLAPTNAQRSANGRLWSGDLKGMQNVLRIEPLSKADSVTVYPWDGKYLNWQQVVDVVTPPKAGLSPDRRYYTGHYNPKVTDATIAQAGPDYPNAWYRLGVPAPDTAPTVGITGGSSGTPETRSYLYTFVTAYGEEGPPSSPTEYTAAHDDATQWDISALDAAPPNSFTASAATHSAEVTSLTTTVNHFLETGEYVTVGTRFVNDVAYPALTAAVTRVDVDDVTYPETDHQRKQQLVAFDGSTYAVRSTPLSGVSNAKVGTLALTFVAPDPLPTSSAVVLFRVYSVTDADDGFTVSINWTTNTFSVTLKNAATATGGAIHSTSGAFTAGAIHNILASWDMAAGSLYLRINDVDVLDTGTSSTTNIDVTYTAGSAEYAFGASVGAGPAYSFVLTGGIGDFAIDMTQVTDFDTESNRRLFFDAAGLPTCWGKNGETPLARQPEVFFTGDASLFPLNGRGNGGAFTVGAGTFTNGTLIETGKALSSVDLSLSAITREAPIQVSGMVKRLYRTDAAGSFKFVADIAIATTTYTDTVADADLGEAIPSTTWIAPPGDMHSLNALPNGFMVGASGRELCFCEPDQFHAWPEGYRLAVDFDIVGIGVYGNTVVACTEGVPYLCTGSTPANMALTTLDYRQACASKRSIVAVQTGVMYAAKSGLVYVGPGGPRLVTEAFMERAEWARYNPSSIRAALYDDRYYGFYEIGGDNGTEHGGFVFDPNERDALFQELSVFYAGVHSGLVDDTLYVIEDDGVVGKFDQGGAEEQTFWKSKVFVTQVPVCFQAAEVNWKSQTGITAAEVASGLSGAVSSVDAKKAAFSEHREGSFAGYAPCVFTVAGGPYTESVREIGLASTLTFNLYAYDDDANDFVLKRTKELSDNEPFRLPGGFEADEWYFELSGNQALVHHVVLAETMEELARPFEQ